MFRRFLLTVLIACTFSFTQCILSAQESAAGSEETKSRPNRQEITELMVQMEKMTGGQQSDRIDRILAEQAGGRTSRPDFMFCTGLAYLGSAKAQACVARAYENGLGVVEDLSEAYTWYALACQTGFGEAAETEKAEAIRDRVKERLVSAYPHPTEEDLEDQVNAQKARIAQYLAEVKKAKK